MYQKKFRIWETALLAALSISLCLGVWAQGRQESISSELLRLHVIAVSDAREEQEIKLSVRDAVLQYLRPVLADVKNLNEAEAAVADNMDGIAGAAAAAAEGRGLRVELGREQYPTREYMGFTLPAGSYDSLRITLGEGRGHNWWCIAFPPLCLSAAQAERVQAVMSPEDYAIVSEAEGYELRFRILELWGELMNALK